MLKIVLTGPESSGKTTLAKHLADHFETEIVPEFARQFIDELDRDYVESDLLEIAKGQLELEKKLIKKAQNLLICDTDLITIKIWSEYKFGRCDPKILDWIKTNWKDHYLLCGTDVPWQFDLQRENPKDREELYEIYKKELQNFRKPFTEIAGNEKQRFQKAIKRINSILKNKI